MAKARSKAVPDSEGKNGNGKLLCQNPSCGKPITEGHYGSLQKVCGSWTMVGCPKCHGAGKRNGKKCEKCAGNGRIKQTCKAWYRTFWSQTRKPPRGMNIDVFDGVAATIHEDVFHESLILVARFAAMRKGEILGLTWGDVLDHEGNARNSFPIRGQWDDVQHFKPTKTVNSRQALMTREAQAAIDRLRTWAVAKGRPCRKTDRIFPITEAGVWKWWVSLQKRLGVANPQTGRPYRFHDLRHTRATELARAKRLDLAQQQLGHKSINTTQIYAMRSAEELIEDMETTTASAARKRKKGK